MACLVFRWQIAGSDLTRVGSFCDLTKMGSLHDKLNVKYCGIHLINLGHGNFFEDVPHDHFEKYKVNNL